MMELKSQIQAARQKIRQLCKLPLADEHGKCSVLHVPDDRFVTDSSSEAVKYMISPLNKEVQSSVTVMNCAFSKGGKIYPHRHNNLEHVHVLAGSLTETVTGKLYKEGMQFSISPNELHGFESDYALLTFIWRPALELQPEEDEAV